MNRSANLTRLVAGGARGDGGGVREKRYAEEVGKINSDLAANIRLWRETAFRDSWVKNNECYGRSLAREIYLNENRSITTS